MASYWFRRKTGSGLIAIYDDEQLRRFLRIGTVSGMELIRADEGKAEWVPLYTLPWYREASKCPQGEDTEAWARKKARRNPLKMFGYILGGYMGLAFTGGMMMAFAQHGNKGAAAATGAVAVSLLASVVGFALARRHKQETNVMAKTEIAHHDELSDALSALDAELEKASDSLRAAANVASIKAAINALREQRTLLAGLESDPGDLTKQLEAARKRLTVATSPSMQDACADEVRALEGRIKAIGDTSLAREENATRLRTLYHEVCSLRLALARARVDVTLEDVVVERLQMLRGELAAETRIAEDLDESARHPQVLARKLGPA